MDNTKDDREKRKRSHRGTDLKADEELGSEGAEGHPFDQEVHPADESTRPSARENDRKKRR